MRKFGLSAAVTLALAAPAWAQYPQTPYAGGYPVPMTDPISGYQPGMYTGGFLPPEMNSPYGPPPNNPTMMLPPGAPGGGMPAAGCGPERVRIRSVSRARPCQPCQQFKPPVVSNETWVRAEWLFWHVRDMPVPPLIVSGNSALPNPGVPGGGNYNPLVGPSRDLGMINGARLTIGQWFDPDGELGGEIGGFIFTRQATSDFFQDSPGRTLGVPFLNTNGAARRVQLLSVPGVSSGSLGLQPTSQLYSGDASLLHRWSINDHVSVDGIFGYRYMQLDESLGLYGRTQAFGSTGSFDGSALPPGVTVFTTDTFRANTQFHGAEIGSRLEAREGAFTFTAFGKAALGGNIETLNIDGQTSATGFGLTRTSVGGVLAVPSNFGRAVHGDVSGLFDVGADVRVKVIKCLEIHAGYNLLYWTNVLRPGGGIDPVSNIAQVPISSTFNPGALGPRPVPTFHSSDLLANGLVLGIVLGW